MKKMYNNKYFIAVFVCLVFLTLLDCNNHYKLPEIDNNKREITNNFFKLKDMDCGWVTHCKVDSLTKTYEISSIYVYNYDKEDTILNFDLKYFLNRTVFTEESLNIFFNDIDIAKSYLNDDLNIDYKFVFNNNHFIYIYDNSTSEYFKILVQCSDD